MKAWRKRKIQRIINELSRVVAGCTSATCAFASEEEGKNFCGTANMCDCGRRAGEIERQLEKEMKSAGFNV